MEWRDEAGRLRNYFNYAGLAPMSDSVRQELLRALKEFDCLLFSDPGIAAYIRSLDVCRTAVAELLGLDRSHQKNIALIPNASFGLGILINGLRLKAGDAVITSAHEHFALRAPLNLLRKKGVEIRELDGKTPDEIVGQLQRSLEQKAVKLVAISHVSYIDGRIFPVQSISSVAHAYGVPVIVDGTQAVGQIIKPLENATTFAAYVFSGHKWLFGPMGTGAMWLNERLYGALETDWVSPSPEPITDARRFEGGTTNIALIRGFWRAVDDTVKALAERIEVLRNLKKWIIEALSDVKTVALLGWDGPQVPGMISYELPNSISAAEFTRNLGEKYGIWVKAFKPPEEPNAIRISYSPWTLDSELQSLARALHNELAL